MQTFCPTGEAAEVATTVVIGARIRAVASIAGVAREFVAEITEQHPDERFAWTTVNGTHQPAVVTFHDLDDTHSRVTLQLDHEPQTLTEKAGEARVVLNRCARRSPARSRSGAPASRGGQQRLPDQVVLACPRQR